MTLYVGNFKTDSELPLSERNDVSMREGNFRNLDFGECAFSLINYKLEVRDNQG